jgi:murein DD-endopeptidase MepM/ murein hydrolase activator NlpD
MKPKTPSPITPADGARVKADFAFRATLAEQAEDPIAAVRVRVQAKSAPGKFLWPLGSYHEERRSGRWPAGKSRVANPRQPTLPAGVILEWQQQNVAASGKSSGWSRPAQFVIAHDSPVVVPHSLGSVPTLDGAHLAADLVLPEGCRTIRRYRIEFAERRASANGGVRRRVNIMRGGPEAVVFAPPKPPLKKPPQPVIETLDGMPAEKGMSINTRRPRVQLSFRDAVSEYEWELTQGGQPIQSATTSDGLAPDGRCAAFKPDEKLALSGGVPNLDVGQFKSPFKGGRKYWWLKYGEHTPYAVDFNRGNTYDDLGDEVYSSAPGTVILKTKDAHFVVIRHWRGKYLSGYGHMGKVHVKVGDRVGLHQLIGRIGGYMNHKPDGCKPHLHYVQYRPAGKSDAPSGMWTIAHGGITYNPVQLTFDSKEFKGSVRSWSGSTYVSKHDDELSDEEKYLSGYSLPTAPRCVLRVRSKRTVDGVWSKWTRLQFFVTATGREASAAADAECMSLASGIEPVYEGPALATGDYTVRYRVQDAFGQYSEWAYDDSLTIT